MTTELEPVPRVSRLKGLQVAGARSGLAIGLETVAVAVSPLVLYVLLSLQGMSQAHLPDPSMHSTYIFAPHAIFERYQEVFASTSRLREAARVGFLVPARLSYLLFGAVPGFFAFRYVLAIVAIVPVYLLMRRQYGRWAGFLAIAVIMSSPVLITAWGTDYPDSAALSYLTGGLAALALSLSHGLRGRSVWVAAGGALLTLAVWSHGAAVPLAAAFVISFVGLRLFRARVGTLEDIAVLAGAAVATTLVLAVGSKLLIGPFNFISPTLRAASYLGTPAQERMWHSSAAAWAPYDPYLLVAPAVVLAYLAAFGRRMRGDLVRLYIGLAGTLAVVTFAYLQFLGGVQVLEMHYLSSPLWSALTVMFVMALAEVSLPLVSRTTGPAKPHVLRSAIPAVLVIAVAFLYANDRPHLPAMTWWDAAFLFALIIVAAALVGRAAVVEDTHRRTARYHPSGSLAAVLISGGVVVVMTAATLVLTVVPGKAHPIFAGTVYDPPPTYGGALGGSAARYIDQYRVVSEVPGFVGAPAYRGEQLLTWWPKKQTLSLQGVIGLYHASFNQVSWSFPELNANGAAKIRSRHIAQILLMGLDDRGFAQAVRSLGPFDPVVVRRRVFREPAYSVSAWLVDLRQYLKTTKA